jgi:hypothetical protein
MSVEECCPVAVSRQMMRQPQLVLDVRRPIQLDSIKINIKHA